MRYLGWIVLSFLGLELLSIILVSAWIGSGWTLLLMIISCALGLFMLRRIGMASLLIAGTTLRNGLNRSLYQLFWPIRYTIAAIMLIIPGFFSDLVAIVLLLPLPFCWNPFKTVIYRRYTAHQKDNSDVIDGDYTVQSTQSSDNGDAHIRSKLPKQ